MSMNRYAGKSALVTGGASGIGRATVLALVREGAKVAFTDMASDAGEALQAELQREGGDVLFQVSDATNEAQVRDLVAAVVRRWGRLDVAINNVGNMGAADDPRLELHQLPLEGWEGTLGVSLRTCFLGMKHQIAQMLKQGGGVIANTASLAGFRYIDSGSSAYAAAKAGVLHLTRFAAVKYATRNIRVNAVAPGITGTQSVLRSFAGEEAQGFIRATHPMGRLVTPEEIAEAFLWVCSDQASAITGHTIPVDGGWAAK